MKVLLFLINLIVELLKGVTYKWIVAIVENICAVISYIKKLCARGKLSHWEKRKTVEAATTPPTGGAYIQLSMDASHLRLYSD